MFINHWNYAITKNWNYEFNDKMLDSNTFCYGRKDAKRISVPARYLHRAIQQQRSAILYSPTKPDSAFCDAALEEALAHAAEKAYRILRIDANAVLTDNDHAQIKAIFTTPTIVCIINNNFTAEGQYHNADKIISEVRALIEEQSPEDLLHVILDGLCANMLVQTAWLNHPMMKFCITVGSEVASEYWRTQKAEKLCDALYDFMDKRAVDAFLQDTVIDFDYAMRVFMRPIETIICTGVNGVKPQDHKEFIAHCFFGRDSINRLSGGRFCVQEDPPEDFSKYARPIEYNSPSQMEIDDNIEESDYGIIAELALDEGKWLVEFNRHIYLSNAHSAYVPATFRTLKEARRWLELTFKHNGVKICDVVSSDDALMYSITSFEQMITNEADATKFLYYEDYFKQGLVHEGGAIHSDAKAEITLTKLAEKDLESYRVKYFINLLEVGEVNDSFSEHLVDMEEYLESLPDDQKNMRSVMWCLAQQRANHSNTVEKNNEEETGEDVFEIPEEYRWKPYVKEDTVTEDSKVPISPMDVLPQSGVLFLGGHQNMTKKLKQIFPDWTYLSDDLFKRGDLSNIKIIFFWTAHSSHSMMEFINARKDADTNYVYVTATNINRLINEMAEKYCA